MDYRLKFRNFEGRRLSPGSNDVPAPAADQAAPERKPSRPGMGPGSTVVRLVIEVQPSSVTVSAGHAKGMPVLTWMSLDGEVPGGALRETGRDRRLARLRLRAGGASTSTRSRTCDLVIGVNVQQHAGTPRDFLNDHPDPDPTRGGQLGQVNRARAQPTARPSGTH